MSFFAPQRSFDINFPELIDRPETDPAQLREELQILEKLNQRSGGHGLAVEYVRQALASANLRSARILDLATGPADIPRAIAMWARKNNYSVQITAVDLHPEALGLARASCRDFPEIRLEQHDLRALPYAPDSFDIVLCSLALHHFTDNDAVTVMRRMGEIARLRYIVNDLRRNWLAIWLTEVLSRAFVRSAILRHDGPQSCRAAFTLPELRRLAERAGLKQFRIHKHHAMFRMILEGTK